MSNNKMAGNSTNTRKTEEPLKSKEVGNISNANQDAIALLTDEHKEIKKLFEEYQKSVDKKSESKDLTALAQKICSALIVHAKVEEELFYPAMRKGFDTDELIDEAAVEHASITALIEQITAGNRRDPLYDAKVKVLGEYVGHHVKEEEDLIFPKARKLMLDMDAFGQAMILRKAGLLAETATISDANPNPASTADEANQANKSSSQKPDIGKANPKKPSSERKPANS